MKNWKLIYQNEELERTKPSKQVVKLVPKFKKENVRKILDHGCGTGRHVKYLAEQGFQVVGLDYSKNALKYAKKLTSQFKKVKFIQSNMDSIPYDQDYFDAIISIHVVQHALKEVRDRAIEEIKRVLKSKCLLFLRTISRKHNLYGKGKEIENNTFVNIKELPDGKTPHHYYSKEELLKYLEGFEIINLEHRSFEPDPDGFWKHGLEEWCVLARKE